LGYNSVSPSDRELAAASENINVILGGHTHTQIKPGSGDEWVTNAIGVPVLVTQNGKSGQWLTEVEIDLDATTDASNADSMPLYRQIAIDSRLDDRIDSSIDSLLQPYRAGVDEMMHLKIGRTARELNNDEPSLLNFIADFTLDMGKSLAPDGKVDIAITNKGSLRRSLPAGNITQGEIIMMQPFDNRIVVEDLSGADLAAALDVMAGRNGDGVSQGVDVVYDAATKKCTSITINGEPLDANRTYRVATIDYLANGGDYMAPLTKGTVLAKSTRIVYADLIDYIKTKFKGKKINPSNTARMRAAK
jgi:2',3'-cyclic-nucleotide 2'-phosphodiesterase (5'-nucleotidase family)